MEEKDILRAKIKVDQRALAALEEDIKKPDHSGKSPAELQIQVANLKHDLLLAKQRLTSLDAEITDKVDKGQSSSPLPEASGQSTPSGKELRTPVSGSQVFQGHAVVVGVGADLPVTIQDAIAVANLLCNPNRCAFPANQVQLLTEQAATRSQILTALDKLAQDAGPDSTTVVYFSGHGYRVEQAGCPDEYYLVVCGYDLDDLSRTCITGIEFTSKLRAIQSRKLLVLLDCCFAGGLAQPKAPGRMLKKAPLPLQAQSILAQGSGRVILGSSRADEESLVYPGNPNSEFTIALLESLAGAGASEKDGYARVIDMALYINHVVASRTGEAQHPIMKISNIEENFAVAYYAGGSAKVLPLSLPGVHPIPAPIPAYDELADGYAEVLSKYRQNLLEIELRMADFIDQRAIPPDFLHIQANLVAKIKHLEQQHRLS